MNSINPVPGPDWTGTRPQRSAVSSVLKSSINAAGRSPRLRRSALLAFIAALLAACGGNGSGGEQAGAEPAPGAASAPTIAGTLAGGVAAASVTAYELAADGSNGTALGSATSDGTGAFRITLARPATGGLRIAASGGSYASAADTTRTVQGVAWSTVLPQVAAAGDSGLVLSPLSAFVDRRYLQLLRQAVPPSVAREQADGFVRGLFGLQGAGVPIDRLAPDFNAASSPGAAFAFALGGLEQLALLFARSPLDVLRAMAEDLADGTVDGSTVGGAPIRFDDTSTAPATLAGGSYLEALGAYLAPTNTLTLLARNGVVPDAQAVALITGAMGNAIRPAQGRYGNNGALLQGAQVGNGVATVAELRKPLAVAYSGSLPLVAGAGWAMRISRTSDVAYIAVPITNVGSATLCFVQLANLTYKDATGRVLLGNRITFVQGSVALVGTGRTATDTCLEPGATGFVLDISTTLSWAAVARIEFGAQASTFGVAPARASLEPQSYAVRVSNGLQALEVIAANVGTGPASASGSTFSTWITLDADLQPLFWGFANHQAGQASVAVGATTRLLASTVLYDGAGTRLLVQVDFDDLVPAATGSAAGAACTGPAMEAAERDACLLAARVQGRQTALRAAERDSAR